VKVAVGLPREAAVTTCVAVASRSGSPVAVAVIVAVEEATSPVVGDGGRVSVSSGVLVKVGAEVGVDQIMAGSDSSVSQASTAETPALETSIARSSSFSVCSGANPERMTMEVV